ncbi:MAG: IS630 family transposase, partial [Novosphingobium sp.]
MGKLRLAIVELAAEVSAELESFASRRKTAQALALRARIEAVIVQTLESLPDDATHWSLRGMARASGLSVSTVQRSWRAFGLQPHREGTFKLSTDPDFVDKVRDIVGLYVSPPAHAIVLCVDEKS